MDWITGQIAIGDSIRAENATEKNVDINLCLNPNCCSEDNDLFDVMTLLLIDGAGNERRYFKDAVDYIGDVVSSGERILVQCHAWRSRSVCMVARYFLVKQGLASNQALEKIKTKREIYWYPSIEEVLECLSYKKGLRVN